MGNDLKNHDSPSSSAVEVQALLDRIGRAMEQDTHLYPLIAELEKTVLARAMERHPSYKGLCRALRIPQATFFLKKKNYFKED